MTRSRLFSATVLLAALLLVALPARAQSGISFEFANVETTASGISFDVVATSVAGAHLGDSQVYLDYNDAFGSLVHENGRLSATLSPALAASGQYYGTVLVNDNAAQRVSLVAEYIGNPGDGLAFSGDPITLFHVEMTALEGASAASVSFDEGLMEGQQFSDDFATTLGDVLAVDLLSISLPLNAAPAMEATQTEAGTVKLTWTPGRTDGDVRYAVEHAEGFAGLFEQVDQLAADGLSKSGTFEYAVEGLPFGKHRFRVGQVGANGEMLYSEEVEVEVQMVERFVLEPAYPNPFNPEATIRFAVKETENVRVELFNALGQRVRVLYDGQPTANTFQQVQIDGSALASGLYIVRVQGSAFVATQKVMLLK